MDSFLGLPRSGFVMVMGFLILEGKNDLHSTRARVQDDERRLGPRVLLLVSLLSL